MDYLKENLDVRQKEEEGFRRWFVNDFFDIIFWYDKQGGELIGFQLCFTMGRGECAFTWEPGSTGSHFVSNSVIDPGVQFQATDVLRSRACVISDEIVSRLIEEAGELDKELLDLILEKLEAYNSSESSQGLSPYI